MSFKNNLLIIYFGFFSLIMLGQKVTEEKESKPALEIFQKKETDYIKNWIKNLVLDGKMTPETTERFTIITSYYGLKMKQLGEDPKLSKVEIIARFNTLIKKQNKEFENILPKDQFDNFTKFYEKLSWSVNKRLNQL